MGFIKIDNDIFIRESIFQVEKYLVPKKRHLFKKIKPEEWVIYVYWNRGGRHYISKYYFDFEDEADTFVDTIYKQLTD